MTKDYVLAALKGSSGYVSGEDISLRLGISRAAVNAAVQALRREGYDISSATNKGYRLNNFPDKLTAGELMAYLPGERMERVICLDTVDSTNSYLMQLAAKDAPEGLVVISNEQTGGRGRRGRSFQSKKDKGIYLSMLMRLDSTPAESAGITCWVAVAVCHAIERLCNVKPGIKWVNDIVMNKMKVCGILTEISVEGETGQIRHIVTGIGLNVNNTKEDFAPELSSIASSIAMEAGCYISRSNLAAYIIEALDKLVCDWPYKNDEYLREYKQRCVVLGEDVRIVGREKEAFGIAADIDHSFGLVVRHEDGYIETLNSGEVSVRGMYGYI